MIYGFCGLFAPGTRNESHVNTRGSSGRRLAELESQRSGSESGISSSTIEEKMFESSTSLEGGSVNSLKL